jgi:hypothetical protein
MTRQGQTSREAGTQSHGSHADSRAAEGRRSHPGVIRGADRDSPLIRRDARAGSKPFLSLLASRVRLSGSGRSASPRFGGGAGERTRVMTNHDRDATGERRRDAVVRASRRPLESRPGVRPSAQVRARALRALHQLVIEELDGVKPFTSRVLRALAGGRTRGRGVSWGTSARTVRGVLARSGPRGPRLAVPEGGETQSRPGRGPGLAAAFPPPLFQGKESRAPSGDG